MGSNGRKEYGVIGSTRKEGSAEGSSRGRQRTEEEQIAMAGKRRYGYGGRTHFLWRCIRVTYRVCTLRKINNIDRKMAETRYEIGGGGQSVVGEGWNEEKEKGRENEEYVP